MTDTGICILLLYYLLCGIGFRYLANEFREETIMGMLIGGSGLLLIAVAAVIAAKITEHRISRNRHNEEVE
jgi:O-antigen ligase